jgi:hypothetical protein
MGAAAAVAPALLQHWGACNSDRQAGMQQPAGTDGRRTFT